MSKKIDWSRVNAERRAKVDFETRNNLEDEGLANAMNLGDC